MYPTAVSLGSSGRVCVDIPPKNWHRVCGWRKGAMSKRILKGTDPQLLRAERAVGWHPWNASLKSDIFIYSASSLSGTLTCLKKSCESLVLWLLCEYLTSQPFLQCSISAEKYTNFINFPAVDAHEYERKILKVWSLICSVLYYCPVLYCPFLSIPPIHN